MQCITTPSFSVLINGSPMGWFTAERGLRQGDPLSPYLFILCGEVLSRILLKMEDLKLIHGVKIGPSCDPISHLMFVDDLIVFARANEKEISSISQALSCYEAWSGQKVNIEKSGVLFSRNIVSTKAASLRSTLGLKAINKDALYLGLPMTVGRSKLVAFGSILDKMSSKVLGWKSKMLSFAGRATLIKAVLSAAPSYTMMHYALPKNLCEKMDSKMRSFWWNHDPKKSRNLCLVAWDNICMPKKYGGLGFRRMKNLNSALMAKLGWQVASGSKKLWVDQLLKKYCGRCSFFHVDWHKSDSQQWKKLLAKELALRWEMESPSTFGQIHGCLG